MEHGRIQQPHKSHRCSTYTGLYILRPHQPPLLCPLNPTPLRRKGEFFWITSTRMKVASQILISGKKKKSGEVLLHPSSSLLLYGLEEEKTSVYV